MCESINKRCCSPYDRLGSEWGPPLDAASLSLAMNTPGENSCSDSILRLESVQWVSLSDSTMDHWGYVSFSFALWAECTVGCWITGYTTVITYALSFYLLLAGAGKVSDMARTADLVATRLISISSICIFSVADLTSGALAAICVGCCTPVDSFAFNAFEMYSSLIVSHS